MLGHSQPPLMSCLINDHTSRKPRKAVPRRLEFHLAPAPRSSRRERAVCLGAEAICGERIRMCKWLSSLLSDCFFH